MPVIVVCPACNSKLKAPENLIGKMVKCPTCAKAVLVTAPAAPPPVAPPPPARQAAPPVYEEPIEEEAIEDEEEDRDYESPRRGRVTQKERSTAMWIHLLPLLLSGCCGLGLILPIVMWSSKRKESAFIDHHGKTLFNFFINLIVISFACSIPVGIGAALINTNWTLALIIMGVGEFVLLGLSLYTLIMYIMAAVKAKNGEWFEYRTLFKVMK